MTQHRRCPRCRPRFAAVIALLLFAGCQQKMADQPSYKELAAVRLLRRRPFRAAGGSRHGRTRASANGRWPVYWQADGKNGEPLGAATPAVVQPPPNSPEEAKARKAQYDDFVDTFPFPMTETVLERGYQRYTIYCAMCHDPLGHGTWQDRRARLYRPALVSHQAVTRSAGRLSVRRDQRRLRLHAFVCRSNPAARSLGDRWLHAGAPGEPTFPRDGHLPAKCVQQWNKQNAAATAGGKSP